MILKEGKCYTNNVSDLAVEILDRPKAVYCGILIKARLFAKINNFTFEIDEYVIPWKVVEDWREYEKIN